MSGLPPAEEIAPRLRTRRYGRSMQVLEITDSTNDDARHAAAQGAADGHVVVADAQRAGRGSHGRSWSSQPGTDLYLSVVARPALPLAVLPPLTLAVGLGVSECADALLAGSGRAGRTQVKWPNDVWLDGRKCAGILVEAELRGGQPGADQAPTLVIGIGLNVNRTQWPDELGDSATSLRGAPEHPPLDRVAVLCRLLAAVERWVDRFARDGAERVVRALDEKLALRGERVRCANCEGELLGVARSGALRLRTAAGVRELGAGRIEPLDRRAASPRMEP